MQIHQPGLFFIALFIGSGGLILLALSLFTLLKTKRLKNYQDKKMLLSASLFTLYGAWYASRALDLPHQDSYRTTVLGWVLLPSVAVALSLAVFLKRGQKTVSLSEKASDQPKSTAV